MASFRKWVRIRNQEDKPLYPELRLKRHLNIEYWFIDESNVCLVTIYAICLGDLSTTLWKNRFFRD